MGALPRTVGKRRDQKVQAVLIVKFVRFFSWLCRFYFKVAEFGHLGGDPVGSGGIRWYPVVPGGIIF